MILVWIGMRDVFLHSGTHAFGLDVLHPNTCLVGSLRVSATSYLIRQAIKTVISSLLPILPVVPNFFTMYLPLSNIYLLSLPLPAGCKFPQGRYCDAFVQC